MALAANRFYLGHGTATLKLEAGTAAARETAGPFRRAGSRFTQQERALSTPPAGGGKTSLLRDWYASAQASRTAWLSIDHGDNDPGQFWAGVVAALRTVYPGSGRGSSAGAQGAR
jgi:hypothetical protein